MPELPPITRKRFFLSECIINSYKLILGGLSFYAVHVS
jgi:hypothetical protein